MVYVIQVCWQLVSRIRMELQFHPDPLWHIPLLCVQWKSPDDGQRNSPKHVEFLSKKKFEKLVHLIGFIIRNLSRCTVTWKTNSETLEFGRNQLRSILTYSPGFSVQRLGNTVWVSMNTELTSGPSKQRLQWCSTENVPPVHTSFTPRRNMLLKLVRGHYHARF